MNNGDRSVFRLTLLNLLLVLILSACQEEAPYKRANDADVNTVVSASDNRIFSQYVAMADGVLLAADIYLPGNATAATRFPAIVEFTRYWRATDMTPPETVPATEIQESLAAGYAYIIVDVRGTGASQGVRKAEFSLAEARDMPNVIDWISRQDWSNGRVATMGISYSGNTAEMAALFPHPALRAAVPRFTDFDWFTSIVVPGGLKNAYITVRWGQAVRKLDLNDASLFGPHKGEPSAQNPLIRGVRPVDSDADGSVLAAASRQHKENASLADQLETLVYRDEYPVAKNLQDSGAKATSMHRSRHRFEQTALPMYQWGSWFDAGTAAGILARFAQWDTPYRYIIGAWSHGANHDANPYADREQSPQPPVDQQYTDIFAFLDPYLKGETGVDDPVKELRYYTMGENQWKTTTIWPPAGQVMHRFYMQEDNSLTKIQAVVVEAADEYVVDFDTGSGSFSRWATQLGGGDVYYGDRAEADRKLLTYTSDPLEQDTELTGSAVISLEVSSTHEDGAFIVYLEDVAPDGYVRMLAEGELRAIHRAVNEQPTHEVFGPFHTFNREDGQPMVPGEITNISFALLPVSVLLPAGHSIRVAIAGHDKDTFIRVPDDGDPVIKVYRQKQNQSWIDLPFIQNK